MKKRTVTKASLSAALVLAAAAPAAAQADDPVAPPAPPAPLAGFERLIGGEWHLEDSHQSFEWGVGRQSVRGVSYFMVGDESQLVSEGHWYWHPGEERIRGTFTAVEMPVVLFDYETRFEGDTMVSELRTFDRDGNETRYRETWAFTDDDHFVWTLLSDSDDGYQPVMNGTYERRRP